MPAPTTTLLLLHHRGLARVDLRGRRTPSVQGVWCQARAANYSDSGNAIASAALAALKLGPLRAGRVWVLCEDFWTETLTVPEDLSLLLNGAELQQALAIEAELDSGISAFHSRMGALPLPAFPSEPSIEPRWLVTQIPSAVLDSLERELARQGARMAGAAHPAIAFVSPESARPDDAPWADARQQWAQLQQEGSGLSPEQIAAAVGSSWAAVLNPSSRSPLAPLLVLPERRPMSHSQRLVLGAGLAAATLLVCSVWHSRTQFLHNQTQLAIGQLEQQLTAHERLEKELAVLQGQLPKLQQNLRQLRAERRSLEHDLQIANAAYTQHNQRWQVLLEALCEAADMDCWIQRLDSQPLQANLTGVAIDNAAAHRFASYLEKQLAPRGWNVEPAATQSTEQGLVAFRIVVEAARFGGLLAPGLISSTEPTTSPLDNSSTDGSAASSPAGAVVTATQSPLELAIQTPNLGRAGR
jgi:Tfp pilus assembly protein PilN